MNTSGPEPASLYDLMRDVINNEKLNAEEKKSLIDELRKNNPNKSDRWTYRWAIWILGIGVILTITLVGVLSYWDKKVPESLIAIGSGLGGGIVGVLSPGRSSSRNDV